jgi:CheY-like chemotaxis protein
MGKHSLLVVNDNPAILKLMCEFLRRLLAQVHVDITDSPNIALHRAMSHEYSAVVTDVMMPGMGETETRIRDPSRASAHADHIHERSGACP